jgi:cytochrome oxidase Cu insertion factor (SCO1/SenC/PrrC family)
MRGRLPLLVALGLLLGVLTGLLLVPGAMERILPKGAVSIGQATVGGPFSLVDHTGKRVTDADYRGRFMLVFFGFTFCPDVCPTALQVSAAALDKLGTKADRIVPLFVTVDPERDTPEQLKSYVSSFHPRLVGLTGTQPEIDAVARAYRVYFKRVKDERSAAGYTMDHTSIVYLMGPDGRFVSHFTHTTSVDAMAAGLARHL